MPFHPAPYPFTPAARVVVLALVLALVGATGVVTFIASSRVETSVVALPVALGLLTRREFWRKAALAYAVLQAAFTVGFLALLLRVTAPQLPAPATNPYAPWQPIVLSIASTTCILVFAFTVLRQAEVKALFRPFPAAPGA